MAVRRALDEPDIHALLIGQLLRLLRGRRRLRLVELAGRAGIHPSTLSRIEAGRQLPDSAVLRQLLHHLGLEVEAFLELVKDADRRAEQAVAGALRGATGDAWWQRTLPVSGRVGLRALASFAVAAAFLPWPE